MSHWHKLIAIPVLTLTVAVSPVLALDQDQLGREPTADEILADALIARPLGLVATVVGAVGFVVSLPFTITSKSSDRAVNTLVGQPLEYTFKRPIGQFDSCVSLPESCK